MRDASGRIVLTGVFLAEGIRVWFADAGVTGQVEDMIQSEIAKMMALLLSLMGGVAAVSLIRWMTSDGERVYVRIGRSIRIRDDRHCISRIPVSLPTGDAVL
jgi:hypothetical protein